MTNPTPQMKAADLFNRIAHVGFEDIEAAQVFADELLQLNRQQPGSLPTKIALAEALLLTGERDDAVDQIGGAYSLRRGGGYAEYDRLALLLYFVAERSKALQVVREYALSPEGAPNAEFAGVNAIQVAAWAGDVELLSDLSKLNLGRSASGMASFFLEAVTEIGAEAYYEHQSALIEAMREVQVAVVCAPTPDADGGSMIINTVFFDRSKTTRRDLEKKVDAAIARAVGNKLDGRVANIISASPASAAPRPIRHLTSV